MSYVLAAAPTVEVDCLVNKKMAELNLMNCVHLVGKNGIVLCDCSLRPSTVVLFERLMINDKFAESLCAKSKQHYKRMVGAR